MTISQYLNDHIAPVLRESRKGTDRFPATELDPIQVKVEALSEKKDYPALKNFLIFLEKQYSVELTDAKNYLGMISSVGKIDTADRKIDLPAGLYEGLQIRMREARRQIVYLSDLPRPLTFPECKALAKRIIYDEYEMNGVDDIRENRFVFPFLISKNSKITGEIILKGEERPQSVVLVSLDAWETAKGEDRFYCRFFGEKMKRENTHDYAEEFYIGNFEADNGQRYMIFSKTPIPDGHCELEGMLVNVTDEVKIGAKATASSNLLVFFATSAKSDTHPINFEEFVQLTKDWDAEKLSALVFGKARHPPFFEKLVLSWLFSGKFSDFPLHLGWIAQTGTAKTFTLDSIIHYQMGEQRWDATTATGLALVPSYGGANVEPGYVVKQKRVGGIDEFFSGFVRSGRKENRLGKETTFLTSLLEHKRVPLGSGKHATTYAQARAKFIFATNPVSKLTTLSDCAQELPRQFLSRVLWYVQTKAHVEFINQNKAKIGRMLPEDVYPKRSTEFSMVFDFLNSFVVAIPEGDDEKIFEKYRDLMPDDLLQEVYLGRSMHHILCLIDGVAKYNSIIQHRDRIECLPADVAEADYIFGTVIGTWNANIDLYKYPQAIRYEYMGAVTQRVFDTLKKMQGSSAAELEKACKLSSIEYHLKLLMDYEMVKTVQTMNGDDSAKRYYTWDTDPTLSDYMEKPKDTTTSA